MARSTLDSMLLAAESHVSKHTLKMPWEKGPMKAIFDARPSLMPAVPVIQAPVQSEPLDSSTFEEAAVKAQPLCLCRNLLRLLFRHVGYRSQWRLKSSSCIS